VVGLHHFPILHPQLETGPDFFCKGVNKFNTLYLFNINVTFEITFTTNQNFMKLYKDPEEEILTDDDGDPIPTNPVKPPTRY
jgi:hypothetical protein